MSGYYCRDCDSIKPLFPPSRERFGEAGSSADSVTLSLEIPCLGTVPFDPELARRCDQGLSLIPDPRSPIPDTPVRRALDDVTHKLLEALS
jgi:hypothetical protein